MSNPLVFIAFVLGIIIGILICDNGYVHAQEPGWNLVAVHQKGECQSLDGAYEKAGYITMVARWVPWAQVYLRYDPHGPAQLNTLHEVCDGDVLWIYSTVGVNFGTN